MSPGPPRGARRGGAARARRSVAQAPGEVRRVVRDDLGDGPRLLAAPGLPVPSTFALAPHNRSPYTTNAVSVLTNVFQISPKLTANSRKFNSNKRNLPLHFCQAESEGRTAGSAGRPRFIAASASARRRRSASSCCAIFSHLTTRHVRHK